MLCIVLPTTTSRGVRDVPSALRAIRVSSMFFVASCLITLVTHETVGLITIAVVWLGHVTVTVTVAVAVAGRALPVGRRVGAGGRPVRPRTPR